MSPSIRLAVCFVALACTAGTWAHSQDAQTEENASSASTPVAHVYVGSGSKILAFSAASSGKLTAIPGSPFNFNVNLMGENGHYLFGFQPGSVVIESLSMAANGALKKGATTNTANYNAVPDCALVDWAGQGLRIDHTGENLYNAAIPGEFPCDTYYQSFRIDDSNGELTFLDNAGDFLLSGATLSFLGNDHFVYTPSCNSAYGNSPSPQVAVLERLSNGELATTNAGAALPPAPMDKSYPGGPVPGYYCPFEMATDPTNHAAITLNSFDNVDGGDGEGGFYGPVVIATFTADANGNLKTTSTYKNMAVAETISGGSNEGNNAPVRMSPSGKLLAVGGSGLEIFHFNGGDQVTKYKLMLTGNSIGQILWDENNHMYALGSTAKGAGELWVYTVTPTSITEASGSPYPITNPGNLVVQTLQ
jgi:hypothetical protein